MEHEVAPRVVVTRPIVGFARMQACVASDATDEEILTACNRESPSGTSLGWCEVIRSGNGQPVVCADDASRLHVLVEC